MKLTRREFLKSAGAGFGLVALDPAITIDSLQGLLTTKRPVKNFGEARDFSVYADVDSLTNSIRWYEIEFTCNFLAIEIPALDDTYFAARWIYDDILYFFHKAKLYSIEIHPNSPVRITLRLYPDESAPVNEQFGYLIKID